MSSPYFHRHLPLQPAPLNNHFNELNKPFNKFRNRGVTQCVDLPKSNKRAREEVETEDEIHKIDAPSDSVPTESSGVNCDSWNVSPDGQTWKRIHRKPRCNLYIPVAADQAPVHLFAPLGPQRLPDLNLHLPSSSRMIGLWIKTRPWALIGLVLPHSIFEYKMNQPMRTLTTRSVTSWMHQSPLSLHRLHLLHRWLQHPVLYLQLYLMKMTLHHHLQIYLMTPLEMFNSNHLSLSTGRSRTRISRPNEPGMTFKKPSAIDHLNLHHYHRNLHYNHLNQHLNHNILHHINLLLDLNDVKTNNLHHIRQLHLMVTSPLKTQQSCPMTLKLT